MPHYKLVASTSRPDVNVDELILSKDENGKVKHSVAVHEARELPEKILQEARKLAHRMGYRIEEAVAPDDEQESTQQPVGVDTVAAAPQIGDGGDEQESPTAPQQGAQTAEAQTVAASGTVTQLPGTNPNT